MIETPTLLPYGSQLFHKKYMLFPIMDPLKRKSQVTNATIEFLWRFTFEQIHNTKEQIYFYKRAEDHKAKERLFESFK